MESRGYEEESWTFTPAALRMMQKLEHELIDETKKATKATWLVNSLVRRVDWFLNELKQVGSRTGEDFTEFNETIKQKIEHFEKGLDELFESAEMERPEQVTDQIVTHFKVNEISNSQPTSEEMETEGPTLSGESLQKSTLENQKPAKRSAVQKPKRRNAKRAFQTLDNNTVATVSNIDGFKEKAALPDLNLKIVSQDTTSKAKPPREPKSPVATEEDQSIKRPLRKARQCVGNMAEPSLQSKLRKPIK